MKMDGKTLGALLLISIGILLLLDNLHYINAINLLSTYWPSIIIFLGISKMVRVKTIKHNAAVFMVAFGIIFQLNELGYINWWQIERYWPVALILIGIWILLNRAKLSKTSAGSTESI